MKITQDDILNALSEAMAVSSNGEASTVPEIAISIGYSERKVRRGLQLLATVGRLEVVRVRRQSLDERTIFVPGYRIKPK